MSETDPFNTSSPAYQMMFDKLGAPGMEMLDRQLLLLAELNSQSLESPLRDSLAAGNPTLPEGTLLHSTGMHSVYDATAIKGIAEVGVVSGELTGVVEDSETHGCADFFRVPTEMSVGDYMSFATETVESGALRVSRGERLIKRGITFIVDPLATGMSELSKHDGYRDPDMQKFVSPPTGRSATDTAAILGGVPRGAIAGILADSRLIERPEVGQQLSELFPGVPVLDHTGKLHGQVRGDVESVRVGGRLV